MKTKIIFYSLFFFLVSTSLGKQVLNEDVIRNLVKESEIAYKTKDLDSIFKYVDKDTVIFIDLDPHPDKGETQISYKEYISMTKMGIKQIETLELSIEILSIDIMDNGNSAILRTRTTARAPPRSCSFRRAIPSEPLARAALSAVAGKPALTGA